MTSPARRFLGATHNPLPGISEALFVQARIGDRDAVGRVATLEQVGVILTLNRRMGRATTTRDAVRGTVDHIRTIAGPDVTFLVDAERYATNHRHPASETTDSSFVDFQLHDLGLPWALADSGFVATGDLVGLEHVLAHAAELTSSGQRVIAPVPIDATWLGSDAALLRDTVERFGVPVALALGHAGDPLSAARNVRGLLHLLASEVHVGVLRSDLSVIGALSGGATFGAIGTRSALRHVFPPRPGKPGPPAGEPAIIIPAARSWVRRGRLAAAIGLTPDERHWICHCESCRGTRLDSLYDDSLDMHNLHAAADLVRRALAARLPLDVWAAECHLAQIVNMEIEDVVGTWTTPDYLGAWFKAIRGLTTPALS